MPSLRKALNKTEKADITVAEAVATYSLTSTKLCSGRHSGDRRLIALRTINAQCMRTRVTGYSSLFVCLYVCYYSSASLRHVCNKLNLPARSLLHSKGFQLTNFAKRKNVSIFFNNFAFLTFNVLLLILYTLPATSCPTKRPLGRGITTSLDHLVAGRSDNKLASYPPSRKKRHFLASLWYRPVDYKLYL